MSLLEIAAVYVGVNLLILFYLALRVVGGRASKKISLGTGGDSDMEVRVRTHGNASEYVPAAMVALVLLALLNAPAWLIHALGGAFTAARLMHPLGMSGTIIFRQIGTALTWLCYLAFAVALFWLAFN